MHIEKRIYSTVKAHYTDIYNFIVPNGAICAAQKTINII